MAKGSGVERRAQNPGRRNSGDWEGVRLKSRFDVISTPNPLTSVISLLP